MRILRRRMDMLRRAGMAALATGLASACSTDDLRPRVDVGETAAVPMVAEIEPLTVPPSPPAEIGAPVEETAGPAETTDLPAGTAPDIEIAAAPVVVPDAPVPAPVPEVTLPPEPAIAATAEDPAPAPPKPVAVAYPRFDVPAEQPRTMPADEIECRRQLKRLGVTFRDVAPIHEGRSCGIEWPVKVSAIGSVRMKPAATLSCSMAATFSLWTKRELVPAARWRYLSGVKTIHQGSSYSCRNIRGSRGTPSQHSKGNALDIMRIELGNGRDIDVRKPGWFAFRQRAFLNTVRRDGCDYFSTVLGPGYNADHADHFHFDIMPRRNGYVACR